MRADDCRESVSQTQSPSAPRSDVWVSEGNNSRASFTHRACYSANANENLMQGFRRESLERLLCKNSRRCGTSALLISVKYWNCWQLFHAFLKSLSWLYCVTICADWMNLFLHWSFVFSVHMFLNKPLNNWQKTYGCLLQDRWNIPDISAHLCRCWKKVQTTQWHLMPQHVLALKMTISALKTQELVKYVSFIQNFRLFSFAYSHDLLNLFIISGAWRSASGLCSLQPEAGLVSL